MTISRVFLDRSVKSIATRIENVCNSIIILPKRIVIPAMLFLPSNGTAVDGILMKGLLIVQLLLSMTMTRVNARKMGNMTAIVVLSRVKGNALKITSLIGVRLAMEVVRLDSLTLSIPVLQESMIPANAAKMENMTKIAVQ